jgi:hypothetical protein
MGRSFRTGAWILVILVILAIIGFRSGVVDLPDGKNVLVNGSFDDGTLSPNCSPRATNACVPPGTGEQPIPGIEGIPPAPLTSVPGWTVVAAPQQDVAWLGPDNPFVRDIDSDRDDPNNKTHRFIDLSGYSDLFVSGSFAGVRQTFTTKAGKKYLLSFSIGVFNDSAQPKLSGPITVVASIDNQPLSPPCGPFNPTPTGARWLPCSYPFTAATASTTLTIVGTAGKSYIGLDNVSVQCVSPLGIPNFCS